MKKIILFVLMIVASVNLFSNELPDDIYYYHKKSNYFHNLVLEDYNHNNNIIELSDGYRLGMFDDDSFGFFIYKTKVYKNNKREVLVIFNGQEVYHFVHFQEESLSGLLLTFRSVRIFNRENVLIYQGDYYLEDGNVICKYHFDPTTRTYYSEYK